MPKPLVPVAGRALLDHVLDRLADAGVERAVVNVHYLADQIERSPRGPHAPADRDLGRARRAARHRRRRGQGAAALGDAAVLPCQFRHDLDRRRDAEPRRGWPRVSIPPAWMRCCCWRRPPPASAMTGAATSPWRRTGALGGAPSARWRRSSMPAPRCCRPRCSRMRRQGAFSLTRLFDRAHGGRTAVGLRLEGIWMHVGTPEAIAGRRGRDPASAVA